MGAESKVCKILREYDLADEPEFMEAAKEIFECGIKEGLKMAKGGMGLREDDDDDYEDEESFRQMWSEGGFGERDSYGRSGGGYSRSGGYGQRRGVKNTGPYAGEYRRRRR